MKIKIDDITKESIVWETASYSIFQAKDRISDQKYFLKSFKEENSQSLSISSRKKREFDLTSAINHPYIGKPLESEFDQQTNSLLYSYFPGQNLLEFIKKNEHTIEDSINIAIQILEALDYLHNNQIIVSNLNPYNIYVQQNGQVKIIDLHRAIYIDELETTDIEKTQSGIFPWLAPEQLGYTNIGLNISTDTYYVGLILYQLISSKLPYCNEGDKFEDLLENALMSSPKKIKEIDSRLNQIIDKAILPSPAERYQTAAGFAYDLKWIKESLFEKSQTSEENFYIGNYDNTLAINQKKIFISRSKELLLLKNQLQQFQNNPNLKQITVTGPSGIGKTRLCDHFLKQNINDKIISIKTTSSLYSKEQQLFTINNIISRFIDEISNKSPEVIKKYRNALSKNTLPSHSGEICKRFPQFSILFKEIIPIEAIEKEKELQRTTFILTELLINISQITTLLIFIDNIQWIDELSLNILKKVYNYKPNIFFLMSTRSDNTDNADSILNLPDQKQTIIKLNSFSYDEIKSFVTTQFDSVKNQDELIKFLNNQTSRTPFEIIEGCRYLLTNNYLIFNQQEWEYHPPTQKITAKLSPLDIIFQNCQAFTGQEKKIINIAALISDEIILEAIIGIIKEEEYQVHNILIKAKNKGIFVSDKQNKYSFVHEDIPQKIIDSLSKDELNELYTCIGNYYLDNSESSISNYLKAAHFLLQVNTDKKTLQLTTSAIQKGLKENKYKSTEKLSLQLIEALPHHPESAVHSPELLEVELYLAEAYRLQGKSLQAIKVFNSLLKEPQIPKENKSRIRYKVGAVLHSMGKYNAAVNQYSKILWDAGFIIPKNKFHLKIAIIIEVLMQLLTYVGINKLTTKLNQSKKKLAIKMLNKIAFSLFFRNKELTLYVHMKALNIADRISSCFEKDLMYINHSIIAFEYGLKKRAYKYLRNSDRLINQTPNKALLAWVTFVKGEIHFFDAKYRDAEKFFVQSIDEYKSLGDLPGLLIPLEHLGYLYTHQGNITKAKRVFNDLLRYSDITQNQSSLLIAELYLAYHNFLSGEQDINYALINKMDKSNIPLAKAIGEMLFATQLLLINDIDEAYNHADKGISIIEKNGFIQEYFGNLYLTWSQIIIKKLTNQNSIENDKIDNKTKLLNLLQKSIAKSKQYAKIYPVYIGQHYSILAQSYLLKHKTQKANKYIQKAIEYNHQKGLHSYEAYANLVQGLIQEDMFQPGLAEEKFEKACQILSEIGMTAYNKLLSKKINGKQFTQNIEAKTSSKPTEMDINKIRLNAVFEVSRLINDIHDLQLLLHQIVNSFIRLSGANAGLFFLNRNTENKAEPDIAIDYHNNALGKDNLSFALEILDLVKESKESVIIHDGNADNRVAEHNKSSVKSVLCIPILKGEKHLGSIYLKNDMISGLFNEGTCNAAKLLALETGVVLDNALLMENYRQLNLQLEEKVKERTAQLADKNILLKEKNANLEAANKQIKKQEAMLIQKEKMAILGDVIAGVAHEINTPLMALTFGLNTFMTENMINKENKNYVYLEQSLETIRSHINTLRDFIKLQENPVGEFDINQELKTTISMMSFKLPSHIIINTELDQSISKFNGNAAEINQVFMNILINAIEAIPSDQKGLITIRTFPAPDSTEKNVIEIEDNGKGMSKGIKDQLFIEKVSTKEEGTGLGLSICKGIINKHNGTIEISSQENKGTTVTIKL